MNYNCEKEETKLNLDELKDNLEPKTSNLGKLKNARRGIALCLATITVLTAGTFGLKKKLENDNQVLGLRIGYNTLEGLEYHSLKFEDKDHFYKSIRVIEYESLNDRDVLERIYNLTDVKLHSIKGYLDYDVSGMDYDTGGLRREDGCEDLDGHKSVYMNLILLK